MLDWLPWLLFVVSYMLAGVTIARLSLMMDTMAEALAPALGKVWSPGVMRKNWPLVVLFWPLVLWATL